MDEHSKKHHHTNTETPELPDNGWTENADATDPQPPNPPTLPPDTGE